MENINQEQLIKREIELNHYLQLNLLQAQVKKYGRPVVVFERVDEVDG